MYTSVLTNQWSRNDFLGVNQDLETTLGNFLGVSKSWDYQKFLTKANRT